MFAAGLAVSREDRLVQTYNEKPRRRLCDLMKSQGMQENQQVLFMPAGCKSIFIRSVSI